MHRISRGGSYLRVSKKRTHLSPPATLLPHSPADKTRATVALVAMLQGWSKAGSRMSFDFFYGQSAAFVIFPDVRRSGLPARYAGGGQRIQQFGFMSDATTYGMNNGSGTSRNDKGEHAPNRDGKPWNCTEGAEGLVPAARTGTPFRRQCSDICRGGFSENHLGRASRHLAQFSRGSSLLRGVGRLGFEPTRNPVK